MKIKSKRKYTDFFDEAEKSLSDKAIAKAKKDASSVILQMKLSELRENQGLKQSDMEHYSQPSLSRLENRKDIKISTLINYVHDLGMEVEIKAKPKNKSKNSFILYKG